ncbi:MAG: AAA family ATPase [Gammaproteobacteria bacterium]|nr:AAA family ATPase [Gammaproteobacteria bacterium]
MNTDLIGALQDPALYDHPVTGFRVIETHSSWVLLTGPMAYKIKKPVDLGFLDFSTLDKRRTDCLEEIRLNRRLADNLYLDVIPITGTPDRPRLGGEGTAIEYAVRMRQFDPNAQLDALLNRGELTAAVCRRLAERIARFHIACPHAPEESTFGRPETIHHTVFDNFFHLAEMGVRPDEQARIDVIHEWSRRQHESLIPTFIQRRAGGHIRECHGDLHLANIALVDDEPVPFDCLEFNADLRWVDTMSEMAFLIMDLDRRGRADLARMTLNTYLECGGDYDGISTFRYYAVYRAMVRAKVAAIRRSQAHDSAGDADALTREIADCLDLAYRYVTFPKGRLILTHGLSGSGKSVISEGLLGEADIVRIRSDVERKRLYPEPSGRYSAEAGRATYEHLAGAAGRIVEAGFSALIDATFLQQAQRARFGALAKELGCPLVILDLQAPEELLRRWIRERAARGGDPSEADEAVLDLQLRAREPLTAAEQARAVMVDTSEEIDMRTLAGRIFSNPHETD